MALDNGYVGSSTPGGGFVSASRLLRSAEAQAVTAELANDPAARGYKTNGVYKDAADITGLLNGTYSIPNPAAQGTVAVTAIPKDTFLHQAADLLMAVAAIASTDAHYSEAQTLLSQWTLLQGIVANLTSINPQQASFQSFFAALVTVGVITQAEVTTLTTEPDPAWQAQLLQPARMSAIGLGTVTIEASDVRTITGVA